MQVLSFFSITQFLIEGTAEAMLEYFAPSQLRSINRSDDLFVFGYHTVCISCNWLT